MSNIEIEREPAATSLRELLAHYDRRVRDALSDAAETTTPSGWCEVGSVSQRRAVTAGIRSADGLEHHVDL